MIFLFGHPNVSRGNISKYLTHTLTHVSRKSDWTCKH